MKEPVCRLPKDLKVSRLMHTGLNWFVLKQDNVSSLSSSMHWVLFDDQLVKKELATSQQIKQQPISVTATWH